jgi:hypothetical protein
MDAQRPEHHAADRALHDGDDDAALDRRTDDRREGLEQGRAPGRLDRDGLLDPGRQRPAVAQQEVGQVEHHGEREDEAEGALADAQRPGGQALEAFGDTGGDPRLDGFEIGQPQPLQRLLQPVREVRLKAQEINARIDLATLQQGIDGGHFLEEQGGDDDRGQDHQRHDDQQRRQGGEVAASGHLFQEPVIERREQHRRDHAPQHGAEQRHDHPGKGQRYRQDKDQKARIFASAQSPSFNLHLRPCSRCRSKSRGGRHQPSWGNRFAVRPPQDVNVRIRPCKCPPKCPGQSGECRGLS